MRRNSIGRAGGAPEPSRPNKSLSPTTNSGNSKQQSGELRQAAGAGSAGVAKSAGDRDNSDSPHLLRCGGGYFLISGGGLDVREENVR